MTDPIKVSRETRETRIMLTVAARDEPSTVQTGIPFLDHMMVTFASYAGLRIELTATGDLKHHLIEDVAIALGAGVQGLLTEHATRYGESTIPMDDALVQASIDTGGRFYYEGPLPSTIYDHWMRSFCENARFTLHLRVLRGRDRHHIVEAAFKAVGMALKEAMQPGTRMNSTKGAVKLERTGC
jgi:imidazoleglycerol-phosphate dehydratase